MYIVQTSWIHSLYEYVLRIYVPKRVLNRYNEFLANSFSTHFFPDAEKFDANESHQYLNDIIVESSQITGIMI